MFSFADWMGNLPESVVHSSSLTKLCIPGSHNTFTYSLRKDGPVANDIDGVKYIGGCCFKQKLYDWSLTQNLDIKTQLECGIRYFDIRLSQPDDKTQPVRIVHGLYGVDLDTLLNEVDLFTSIHPKELVLLDFNHFYNISSQQHFEIIERIQQQFKRKLCPPISDLAGLNLHFCWLRGFNIIVFYQVNVANNPFWTNKMIVSPWANTNNINNLLNFTEKAIQDRSYSIFFNCQGILTPKMWDVVRNCGTLRDFAKPATEQFVKFIGENLSIFKSKLNIITIDFVDPDNFARFVIDINYN